MLFLEECKYVAKEKKIPKYIIGNVEKSSDSDRESSDEEISNKKILIMKTLIKKILMKKIEKYFL